MDGIRVHISGPGGCLDAAYAVMAKALEEYGFKVVLDQSEREKKYASLEGVTLDSVEEKFNKLGWKKTLSEMTRESTVNKVYISTDNIPWGG